MQYHPGVPTEQRAEDIVLFAAILLGEYRQGTPLHDIPQAVEDAEAEDGTTFVVEVDAAGNSLSGLLATFGAVQLAVDAAWVAVQYDRVASPEPLDYEFLQELANGPNLSLEIVELSAGTFKGFFKARFPGPVSRAVVYCGRRAERGSSILHLPSGGDTHGHPQRRDPVNGVVGGRSSRSARHEASG